MTQLTLYNSLSREKEPFRPMDPKRVTMYNCGPTVYSYAHIGNARAAVVADVLFRVLRHIYGEEHVVYARNITDVDDKIIAAAKEQGVPISEITEKYARIYNEDLAALNCLPPTVQPKATDNISGMIAMIETLLRTGPKGEDDPNKFAYQSDGHVFFDVEKYDEYGQLSGNTLDALKRGDRVGEGEMARKRNAADFVLWKPELDGVGWDAPFGRGRPGWHIECSVMAKATLCNETYGNTIDIHCGGIDLKFPHHENERAQSCCANDTQNFANYWVHNEFLNMGKDKMSKSLGNVVLVHDLLKEWDGEVIRLALLKAHYRSELVWSEELLKESKAQLDGWYRSFLDTSDVEMDSNPPAHRQIILDDLQTPNQISIVSNLLNNVTKLDSLRNHDDWRKRYSEEAIGDIEIAIGVDIPVDKAEALQYANLLGLLQKDPEEWFRGGLDYDALVEEYDAVRAQALAAKQAGDKARMSELFKRSDEIRDQFKTEGVIIESGPDGKSTWRRG